MQKCSVSISAALWFLELTVQAKKPTKTIIVTTRISVLDTTVMCYTYNAIHQQCPRLFCKYTCCITQISVSHHFVVVYTYARIHSKYYLWLSHQIQVWTCHNLEFGKTQRLLGFHYAQDANIMRRNHISDWQILVKIWQFVWPERLHTYTFDLQTIQLRILYKN